MGYKYVVESWYIQPFCLLRESGDLPADYTLKMGMLNSVVIKLDKEMDAETLGCLESMNGTTVRKIKVLQSYAMPPVQSDAA